MVTEYMASKGGKVYMVCRNKERGEQARQELSEKTGNDELELMIADVSLKADVRRLAHEFETKSVTPLSSVVGANVPKHTRIHTH